ncbi:TrkH family potassium uptake protein [Magnetofaba australis]|uniref:Trk system potassium uptake protein n=1 Tax=Magnetofaba australis IT-1 TaxID=1434232 RepID=A0A1Y2K4F9_9PROT|nr:TrkH family potassium uptake protein [Magnetofaba australis]OSM02547.1 putative cation transporter [Magnetofaba australis IT-1]
MNWRMDLRLLAALSLMVAMFEGGVLLYAWYAGENLHTLIWAIFIALIVGACGWILAWKADPRLGPRDGFLVATAGWGTAIFLGALPYVISHHLGWADALFESASGFTTTGSSVLGHPEGLPRSLLLWRSLTQWIGGMGMLLLTIAILPFLRVGGMQLMKAETPGPRKERLTPRLITTARILWGLYVGLTALAALGYWLFGMTPFEALNHALTTMATGGFSTSDSSFVGFSPAAQWWATLFMMLAGTNFLLHYRLVFMRDLKAFGDREWRVYMGVALCAAVMITLLRMFQAQVPALEAAREAFFQVASILTTTGYASADWEQWEALSAMLLILLMGVGGMSGSTAGGPKVVRVSVAFVMLGAAMRRLLQPRRVQTLMWGGRDLPMDVVEGCVAMLAMTILLTLMGGVVLHLMGVDMMTALSAALTCLTNVGPGYGGVGAMDNFSALPQIGKLLLAVLMVVGRLEIFTVLILLWPGFWRR